MHSLNFGKMGLIKFENLPVNTIVGADKATFRRLMEGTEIDPSCRTKYNTTRFIRASLDPFYRSIERRYKRLALPAPAKDPVFILGHWRSGTTFLHNILSCDERFGCCSTYQTVFPHMMLWGQPFFKWCMEVFMPSTRPTDSMKLGADLPQEEEFALTNMTPSSHYHFWNFPKRMAELRDKFLVMQSCSEAEREEFKEALDKMIRIALHCSGKEWFLSKNPPHTGRVKTLLEMYPNAKFIYLVRNPYTVYESTSSFFNNTMAPICWQKISREELRDQILENYKALYRSYESEKHLIPAGNLIEVRFEDVEAAPLQTVENIYNTLSLGGFEAARPAIERHLESHRGFKKNRYNYAPETIKVVEENWGEALEQWGYTL